jgi:hypothetical protein
MLQHLARDRAALAQHQVLLGQRRQRRAATGGQRMSSRGEQHDVIAAQPHGV